MLRSLLKRLGALFRSHPPVAPPVAITPAVFAQHVFASVIGPLHYWLAIPAHSPGTVLGLIVMLHGCKQDAVDFSRGTRMNAKAGDVNLCVAYPAQAEKRNMLRCWNWFDPANLSARKGEALAIADLASALVAEHSLDAARCYIAGMSAGAAMALNVATLYPRRFAAVGVHSGLPFAVAHDVPSALAAMKMGPGKDSAPDTAHARVTRHVPTIAFHGDADHTVNLRNTHAVIADAIKGMQVTAVSNQSEAAAKRSWERTVYSVGDALAAEQWIVQGGAHAWFGGDDDGSFTDPNGPDASAHLLAFCAKASAQQAHRVR